ncbi:MAG: aconitase X swivel domain-containing protein [Acidimicrobiia bacterium]
MSKRTYNGRVVIPGDVTGTATVSRQPFNTTGSYLENMFAGRTDGAPCTDSSNAELYQKDMEGMILCTPLTVGSTMGGMTLMGMASIGVGPQALLFSKPLDTLAAAGVLMADIWQDKQIVTIDMLGDEFLEAVNTGDPIAIHADGTVEVG